MQKDSKNSPRSFLLVVSPARQRLIKGPDKLERRCDDLNINDIAKKTGYSIATVSRAINRSGYVSEKARTRILQVVEEEGYSVNPFAKGMATSSMKLAGILSTDSRDFYQAECIYYLQDELRHSGFTALLACTGLDLREKKEGMALLLSRKVDVVFLIGSQFIEDAPRDNEYLRKAARQVPVILMNGFLEGDNLYSIRCDDFRGGYDLAQTVLKAGSRHPAMVMRRLTYSTREKLRGFEQACQEAGLTSDQFSVLNVPFPQPVFPSVEELLQDLPCDALVCADDQLALTALKACKKMNLQVPEQIQVTGYNASGLSTLPVTEITSYDNRIPYLCATAVSCMKAVLDKKDYPADTRYTGQLIRRDSTG